MLKGYWKKVVKTENEKEVTYVVFIPSDQEYPVPGALGVGIQWNLSDHLSFRKAYLQADGADLKMNIL